MAVLGAASAQAAVVYPPEGGTWYHGVDGSTVYSHYYHNQRTHKSTACGAERWDGPCTYSGWKAPGVAALAEHPARSSGNTAFYDVR